MSPKLSYFFHHIYVYNSKIKRSWTRVVKGWLTYREAIRDTVRAREAKAWRKVGW